jgi:hypothetical protein
LWRYNGSCFGYCIMNSSSFFINIGNLYIDGYNLWANALHGKLPHQ